jgi:hypothetical protein
MAEGWMQRKTHTVRNLDMLHEHRHLLFGKEALEVVPRLLLDIRCQGWVGAVPEDTFRKWEKILHQGCLARQLHVNRAVAQPAETSLGLVL